MARFCLIACLFLFGALTGSAQITKRTLTELYGPPINSTFAIGGGTTIQVSYGPHHQACVLKISVPAPVTYISFENIFNAVLPIGQRGQTPPYNHLEECEAIAQYEKATMQTAFSTDGQIAEPNAYIELKSKACESVVAIEKPVFSFHKLNP